MALEVPVVDGEIQVPEDSQQKTKKSGADLGKDDFLLLLVTQMQYQDPLDPADNTEYVAQLAQFSELEQMTNLNSTTTNTSAYSLVGKDVLVRQTSSTGQTQEIQGTVQYVTIKSGEAYVVIDGQEYSYDDIVTVFDSYYLISMYLPSVMSQTVSYTHGDSSDVTIQGVSLGSNGYEASSFAVVLVDEYNQATGIDAKYLKFEKGKLTIDNEAFKYLPAGTYTVAFVFDDTNNTMDYQSVTLIINGTPEEKPPEEGNPSEDGDSSAEDGSEESEETA